MSFLVTLRVKYHNGTAQTVKWREEGLVKDGPDGKPIEPSLDEAQYFMRESLLKAMKEKTVFTPPDVSGYVEFIPFDQVFRMAFKIEEFKEGNENV